MEADAQSQPDALSAGRRIYLGNLLYEVKPSDIEEVLADKGFGNFEHIHISIDPVSGRNPGYCFVDFADRETAERALSSLSATIAGRLLKVGPCEPKKQRARDFGRSDTRPGFQRWGDWSAKSVDEGQATGRPNYRGAPLQQGPQGALKHFDDVQGDFEGRRLFVGGLGKMTNQAQNMEEMTAIFQGFHPTAIGKRVTNEAKRSMPGNHNFCFVDFETRLEAAEAMKALDGRVIDGGRLRVRMARQLPEYANTRPTGSPGFHQGRRADADGGDSGRLETASPGARAMASRDWRRKGDS
ncbi:hypothetical protein HIM_09568 [Hirsutella minnesotensis 3608]|uniref:RRM domain-containing protein n=1 Tax=Hirsutella minnesotensis 3608 TaxID=1043627 RepID=A0A0F7ZGK3_9HYPO|nr:hypothetical protein HIM_09568 [Hirsutella minnesotensis 3608]